MSVLSDKYSLVNVDNITTLKRTEKLGVILPKDLYGYDYEATKELFYKLTKISTYSEFNGFALMNGQLQSSSLHKNTTVHKIHCTGNRIVNLVLLGPYNPIVGVSPNPPSFLLSNIFSNSLQESVNNINLVNKTFSQDIYAIDFPKNKTIWCVYVWVCNRHTGVITQMPYQDYLDNGETEPIVAVNLIFHTEKAIQDTSRIAMGSYKLGLMINDDYSHLKGCTVYNSRTNLMFDDECYKGFGSHIYGGNSSSQYGLIIPIGFDLQAPLPYEAGTDVGDIHIPETGGHEAEIGDLRAAVNNFISYETMTKYECDEGVVTQKRSEINFDGGFKYFFGVPIEEISKMMNMLGMYWTGSPQSALYSELGSNCTDDKVHLPIITEYGATGECYSGEDIKKLPYADSTDVTDIPFDPKDEDIIDNNTYTNTIKLNSPALSPIGLFANYYGITYNKVLELNDFLWNTDEDMFDTIINGLRLFSNPIDSIISLKMFPFNVVKNREGVGDSDIIRVGRTSTGVVGKKILPNWYSIIDMGSCTFYKENKNFLDYDPYTSATLYLPYIGSYKIPTAEFIGKTITVKYIVDIITGSCTACVFANEIPILCYDGIIATEIPITSDNSSQFASQIVTTALSTLSIPANPVGALTSTATGLMSLSTTPQKTGSSTPYNSNWQPMDCYLLIERPNTFVPSTYGRNVGFVYNKSAKLSTLKGFTICENVNIDIASATVTELEEVKELLEKGVIL